MGLGFLIPYLAESTHHCFPHYSDEQNAYIALLWSGSKRGIDKLSRSSVLRKLQAGRISNPLHRRTPAPITAQSTLLLNAENQADVFRKLAA